MVEAPWRSAAMPSAKLTKVLTTELQPVAKFFPSVPQQLQCAFDVSSDHADRISFHV
jgi:hypothetical protein